MPPVAKVNFMPKLKKAKTISTAKSNASMKSAMPSDGFTSKLSKKLGSRMNNPPKPKGLSFGMPKNQSGLTMKYKG